MSKGKVGLIVALVIVGVVVAFGVLLFGVLGWAHSSGEKMQADFFEAVYSGEPNRVMDLCAPEALEDVDAPVLAQWMAAMKAGLGHFKELSKTSFNTSKNVTGEGTITRSSGKVIFEKGDANCELVFCDGKIVTFHVVPSHVATDWFKGLSGDQTQLYRDRGKRFLTCFFTGKAADAFAMMHASLQKAAPMEKLQPMMADASAKIGPLKSTTYLSESTSPDGVLKILYKIECEKATQTGSIKFEQAGLKMHLIAFNINEKDLPASAPAPEKP